MDYSPFLEPIFYICNSVLIYDVWFFAGLRGVTNMVFFQNSLQIFLFLFSSGLIVEMCRYLAEFKTGAERNEATETPWRCTRMLRLVTCWNFKWFNYQKITVSYILVEKISWVHYNVCCISNVILYSTKQEYIHVTPPMFLLFIKRNLKLTSYKSLTRKSEERWTFWVVLKKNGKDL